MAPAAAKLTPPRCSAFVVTRERLHRQLDAAAACGAVWIVGPAGAGKTTLAADWARARKGALVWYDTDEGDNDVATFAHGLREALAHHRMDPLPDLYRPEPRQPLAAFARSFARRAHAALPAQALLVVDNAERLEPHSEGSALLFALVGQRHADAVLLILGRHPPPASLARARLDDRLAVLDWTALALTADETLAIVRRRCPSLPASQAEGIHALAAGWPAAVRLLAEQAALGEEPIDAAALAGHTLFDYLAQEVFAAQPPARQRLLLAVAALPGVGEPVAARLSGEAEAGRLLDEMAHEGLLVHRLPGTVDAFRLHPLLRRVLLGIEARSVPAPQRAALRRQAAAALVEQEDFSAAAALLIEVQDPDALQALIERVGPKLLEQGQHQTLLAWLAALPAQRVAGRPALGLWQAMGRAPQAPAQAVAQLQSLWPALERELPPQQLVLAWQTLVRCHHMLRRGPVLPAWGDELNRLLARLSAGGEAALRQLALASAFVPWQRDGGAAGAARPCALALALQGDAPSDERLMHAQRLLIHATVFADVPALPPSLVAAMRRLCADGRGAPMARLMWMFVDAVERFWRDPDESLASVRTLVTQCDSLLSEHGIEDYGLLDVLRITLALHDGKPALAAATAARLQSTPPAPAGEVTETAHRHAHLASWHLMNDDPAPALAHAERAVRVSDGAAMLWQRIQFRGLLARAAARLGRPDQALHELRLAARIAREHHTGLPRCGPWLVAAALALERGRMQAAAAHMRRALAVMAAHGVLRPSPTLLSGPEFTRLCALAWARDIGRGWVQHLVAARGLAPPPGADGDDWPWALRVRSLGALEIERHGQRLDLGRKPPRKVLELLRWLLCAGPQPRADTLAVDTLWPDLDGAAAQHAFATALYRLRRLLGADAVVHADGRLALNPRCVWVDSHAFQRLLEGEATEAMLRQALDLYRGPLLGDDDDGFARPRRDALRARHEAAVGHLGERLAARRDWSGAREVYERGLAIDPLAETFYRGAILACLSLGLVAQARLTRRRAERALARVLGIDLPLPAPARADGLARS